MKDCRNEGFSSLFRQVYAILGELLIQHWTSMDPPDIWSRANRLKMVFKNLDRIVEVNRVPVRFDPVQRLDNVEPVTILDCSESSFIDGDQRLVNPILYHASSCFVSNSISLRNPTVDKCVLNEVFEDRDKNDRSSLDF